MKYLPSSHQKGTVVFSTFDMAMQSSGSDRADVTSFEYADSHKLNEDFPEARWDERDNSRRSKDGFQTSNMPPRAPEREYSDLSRNLEQVSTILMMKKTIPRVTS
ncbi:hypothetical protein AgCh_020152 [Apium graveolens]